MLQCCSSCHVCKLQISLWTKNQTNPWRSAYTLSHRHPTLSHTHTQTHTLLHMLTLSHMHSRLTYAHTHPLIYILVHITQGHTTTANHKKSPTYTLVTSPLPLKTHHLPWAHPWHIFAITTDTHHLLHAQPLSHLCSSPNTRPPLNQRTPFSNIRHHM